MWKAGRSDLASTRVFVKNNKNNYSTVPLKCICCLGYLVSCSRNHHLAGDDHRQGHIMVADTQTETYWLARNAIMTLRREKKQ